MQVADDASPAPRKPVRERFALGGLIGEGAMGAVFLARDEELKRQLAVKVVSGHQNTDLLKRFVREAQVSAQLSHPNIVPVHSLETTADGLPALAMKYVQGGTFTEYLATCRRLQGTPRFDPQQHGLAARLEHFLKACDAIAYAHARGVVHRDIKPDNLMLGAFGEVYVMDWGIARVEGVSELPPSISGVVDTSLGHETRFDVTLGTMRFMPPEQLESSVVGPSADQFALGMTLFEVVTLEPARPRNQPLGKILGAVADGRRRSFRDVEEPVSPTLRAIVIKATAPAMEDRYDSVEELAADLRRWLRDEEVHAAPDSRTQAVWRKLRRHPVRVLTAVLAIVLVAAAVSIAGLGVGLRAERDTVRKQAVLAELMSTVGRRVQEFDHELTTVEIVLESLAIQAREIALDGGDGGDYLTPRQLEDGQGPADARLDPRYAQMTTYERPVVFSPPPVSPEVQAFSRRLVELEPAVIEVAVRSAGDANVTLPPAAQQALLRDGVPIQYAYVGFRNGVIINYPGVSDFGDTYDPRARPWYTANVEEHGPRWGALYNDATGGGFLLPCNRAIFDREGALLGVAGTDLSMDHVIDDIAIDDLAGVRDHYLIDAEGRIIVRSSERGLKVSKVQDGTRERVPLGVPAVTDQLSRGTVTGFARTATDLWVFGRLEAVPWTLAVQLDPAAHGL